MTNKINQISIAKQENYKQFKSTQILIGYVYNSLIKGETFDPTLQYQPPTSLFFSFRANKKCQNTKKR